MASEPAEQTTTPSAWRLFARARRGDNSALGRLLGQCLPPVQRWAHQKLPHWARGMADTTDLVQDAVVRTLDRLDRFEFRGPRALSAYLHHAVRNQIRDEHRRIERRGVNAPLSDGIADPTPSPLEQAIASQTEARYRAALARLRPDDRELIVAHIELDYSHDQLACMTGRTRNAARMALQRAIRRLAQQMRDG
jgi:RNA polymerase sigma-70 factor, ECF subfamily